MTKEDDVDGQAGPARTLRDLHQSITQAKPHTLFITGPALLHTLRNKGSKKLLPEGLGGFLVEPPGWVRGETLKR